MKHEIGELIGEEVKRPDGLVFRFVRYKNHISAEMIGHGLGQYYVEEITALGSGNFAEGLLRLGREHYSTHPDNFRIGTKRLLNDEIFKNE